MNLDHRSSHECALLLTEISKLTAAHTVVEIASAKLAVEKAIHRFGVACRMQAIEEYAKAITDQINSTTVEHIALLRK